MAVELAGTWVFDDRLFGGNLELLDITFLFNFDSNGYHFTGLALSQSTRADNEINFMVFGNDNDYPTVYTSQHFGEDDTTSNRWLDENFKNITITSKLSEVTDGDVLLTWLQANATKIETDTSKKLAKLRYITPTKNLFNIGLSTNWQDPVNSSYGYVPFFIGVGETCTISWDLEYYRKHPGTKNLYMCINTGEQPSTSNRNWLYHQTIPSLQKSQVTVSANSTGYIYFELANGYNENKEYLQKYLFNENLKWQLELGNQKTDYVPHGYLPINKIRYITPTKNLFNINLSTDWQPPINNSYGYVPIFIGVGKTCTISWDLEYYRKHPAPRNLYMCINTGEQPSSSNRAWLYHQTITSLQKSQQTVSANSTGYIYFELADGYNSNKEYFEKYLFNENLKWQLELGSEKTDYVPHGYLPLNKGVKL